jgi:hypothetical protein
VGDLRAQAAAGHACRPPRGRRRPHEDLSCGDRAAAVRGVRLDP